MKWKTYQEEIMETLYKVTEKTMRDAVLKAYAGELYNQAPAYERSVFLVRKGDYEIANSKYNSERPYQDQSFMCELPHEHNWESIFYDIVPVADRSEIPAEYSNDLYRDADDKLFMHGLDGIMEVEDEQTAITIEVTKILKLPELQALFENAFNIKVQIIENKVKTLYTGKLVETAEVLTKISFTDEDDSKDREMFACLNCGKQLDVEIVINSNLFMKGMFVDYGRTHAKVKIRCKCNEPEMGSYEGFLIQQEIKELYYVTEPEEE